MLAFYGLLERTSRCLFFLNVGLSTAVGAVKWSTGGFFQRTAFFFATTGASSSSRSGGLAE